MNIVLISGSRADRGGLESVFESLKVLGFKPEWYSAEGVLNAGQLLLPNFDIAIALGDRFETLRAVVELYIKGVAIAHLSGGDITEGSQDDCMRHAISKLSHLHFVTNKEAARRVIQMGEEPWRVHNVGYPGVDNLELQALEQAKSIAGIVSYDDFLLVVWHPDTLAGVDDNSTQVQILTMALDKVFMKTLVIGPNADEGHQIVSKHLKKWCLVTKNVYVDELPRKTYLTLLKHCKCLVGNSSSGYYEAPSLETYVIDIGDRQKGRIKPPNIISCRFDVEDICQMIRAICDPDVNKTVSNYVKMKNPYWSGTAAQRIASIIAKIDDPKKLLRKRWHDVGTTTTNSSSQSSFEPLWNDTTKVQTPDKVPNIQSLWDQG